MSRLIAKTRSLREHLDRSAALAAEIVELREGAADELPWTLFAAAAGAARSGLLCASDGLTILEGDEEDRRKGDRRLKAVG